MLVGWILANPGTIRALRLSSASQTFAFDLEQNILWIDRADVIVSMGQEHGFSDPSCGFIAYVPTPGHDERHAVSGNRDVVGRGRPQKTCLPRG